MTQYKNPIPVAVALVMNPAQDKLLVGRRGIEPFIGKNALIGGYVDEGENFETAISREVLEETGQQLDQGKWTYQQSSITPRNQVLIFFKSTAPDLQFEQVADTPEMSDIRWVTKEELLADPLCFPLHQQVALKAFDDALALRIKEPSTSL